MGILNLHFFQCKYLFVRLAILRDSLAYATACNTAVGHTMAVYTPPLTPPTIAHCAELECHVAYMGHIIRVLLFIPPPHTHTYVLALFLL